MSQFSIQRLRAGDAADFHQLRLQALHDAPSSFTTSLSTEEGMTPAQCAERMEGATLSAVWGARDVQGQLVASTGLLHDAKDKVRHKATIYAVYVAPQARGQGLSRQLVEAALAYARSQPLLDQVLLSVTSTNTAAHRLYLSLGFAAYGCEPRAIVTAEGYHDQILMHLPLGGRAD